MTLSTLPQDTMPSILHEHQLLRNYRLLRSGGKGTIIILTSQMRKEAAWMMAHWIV